MAGHIWTLSPGVQRAIEHSARTAAAGGVSLAIAEFLRLPAAYWAPITAIVVMQSTVGAAWTASVQRFAGTLLGAAVGALITPIFGPNLIAFTMAIFVMGLLCAVLRIDNPAYRFAGITLAMVMLISPKGPPWQTSLHRAIEVTLGIVVALGLTYVWPEPTSNAKPPPR